jgi:hypothetical protein
LAFYFSRGKYIAIKNYSLNKKGGMNMWKKIDRIIIEETPEGRAILRNTRNGMILTTEEALVIIEKLLSTYNSDDVDEIIENTNEYQKVINAGFDFESKGRYYRFNNLVYSRKEFRRNLKRDWSFKCGWCGRKVSSKTDKEYYQLCTMTDFPFERACSEVCIQHIWDELLMDWLNKNGFTNNESIMEIVRNC